MMTLRKWIWFLSCFFVLAMTVDALALPADSAGEGWTVMVYMVGASDMVRPSNPQRDYFGLDLKEMQAAVRDDTTLLVMTGGAAVRNTEFISEGSGIYRITREGSWLISEYEESMVDPEALQYLLQTGLENAHGSTALILWDHGYGAFEGFGNENRDDQKRLTMPELREALHAPRGLRVHILLRVEILYFRRQLRLERRSVKGRDRADPDFSFLAGIPERFCSDPCRRYGSESGNHYSSAHLFPSLWYISDLSHKNPERLAFRFLCRI